MSNKDLPISSLLANNSEIISVEFSPPRSDDAGRQLLETAKILKERIAPDFVSITYGAGGSTRVRTEEYARILRHDYEFDVVAHLTCVERHVRNSRKSCASTVRRVSRTSWPCAAIRRRAR